MGLGRTKALARVVETASWPNRMASVAGWPQLPEHRSLHPFAFDFTLSKPGGHAEKPKRSFAEHGPAGRRPGPPGRGHEEAVGVERGTQSRSESKVASAPPATRLGSRDGRITGGRAASPPPAVRGAKHSWIRCWRLARSASVSGSGELRRVPVASIAFLRKKRSNPASPCREPPVPEKPKECFARGLASGYVVQTHPAADPLGHRAGLQDRRRRRRSRKTVLASATPPPSSNFITGVTGGGLVRHQLHAVIHPGPPWQVRSGPAQVPAYATADDGALLHGVVEMLVDDVRCFR